MDLGTKPIAVVQGAPSSAIQQIFRDFIDRWKAAARLVGVVEDDAVEGQSNCGPGLLRNIADDRIYPLFQDLGSGSTGCSLDPAGAVLACDAVQRDIAAGCDLVVLSKFGKMEAEGRTGLMSAFATAVEAGIPVLSSVAPKFQPDWERFAGPLFVALPPDLEAIESWWKAVRASAV